MPTILEKALAYIADYGGKVYLIVQDITQLNAVYGKDNALMANGHVRIAYAPNTIETAKTLSEMTGKTTVVEEKVSLRLPFWPHEKHLCERHGKTAQQWRKENQKGKGNMRDYASLEQLIVISNIENINALLISQKISQGERLVQLSNVTITQMKSLLGNQHIRTIAAIDTK